MIKNDYRREMILLRPLDDGFSGFCRIETRVSRGSITYNIRASHGAGRLYAVLVGARGGRWQTAIGGEIRADALGQAGFYWELDPRSIDGLALENYALVGVATDGADAHLVLVSRTRANRWTGPPPNSRCMTHSRRAIWKLLNRLRQIHRHRKRPNLNRLTELLNRLKLLNRLSRIALLMNAAVWG